MPKIIVMLEFNIHADLVLNSLSDKYYHSRIVLLTVDNEYYIKF